MEEGVKGRWVAWRFAKFPLQKNETPGIGAIVRGRLYHDGGITSFTFKKGSIIILKDYGRHTAEEFDAADLLDQFDQDFPVETGTMEELVELRSGWISPSGEIYPCKYGDHEDLAKRLCKANNLKSKWKSGAGWLTTSQDILIRSRWVRISPVGIWWDLDQPIGVAVTKRQIKRIHELASAIETGDPDIRSLKDLGVECVEGTSEEMLKIADAIEHRREFYARRCAVDPREKLEGRAEFWSPRNSTRNGTVSLEAADKLAAMIRSELSTP